MRRDDAQRAHGMNRSLVPLVLLLTLYLCLVGFLAVTAEQLPERSATHFNASGEPDGWMSRTGYLRFTLLFGLAVPLLVIGTCYLVRFLPASLVNIPHRDYWLTPERKRESVEFLFHHSLWLGCLIVTLMIAMHATVLHANQQTPPRLSMTGMLLSMGFFLAGTVLWTIVLMRRFRRPKSRRVD